MLKAVNHGQSGRDLVAAIFVGDQAIVRNLLAADPVLRTTHVPPVAYPNFAPDGQYGDLLTFAVARCDPAMIDMMLALGVPANGALPGSALDLALRSGQLALAERLLKAGAQPDAQPGDRIVPMLSAGRTADPDAARLLLDYRANPNWRDGSGTTILQSIVDMDSMRVAEILINAGADPWAPGPDGALPARGIFEPLRLHSGQEETARQRLIGLLSQSGGPWPPPDPKMVRSMVADNRWPPPGLPTR